MRKYLLPISYCLLSVVLFSCGSIEPVTIGGIQNTNVKSLSPAGVDFSFGMKIKNPNKMGVTVFPASFDANVNGIDVGKVKLSKKVKIKAKSDDVAEFNIKSDFSKLGIGELGNIISMVASKSATVTLKGEIKVGKWYCKKKFPIELTKTINLSTK
jgi:LEA14-like dessication related protein